MSEPLVCPFCGTDHVTRQVGENWSCVGCSAELRMIALERGPEIDVLTEPPLEDYGAAPPEGETDG